MAVRLISITPEAEKTMLYVARVSSENQENTDTGLLKYCLKHAHWSVFEHAFATLEIETSRAISAQITRHRSFAFSEFCIAGDSMISCVTNKGAIRRRSIERLYELQNDVRWGRLVRVLDEATQTLVPAKVREVFKTGMKPVLKVTLGNGKVLTTTKEHKFLSRSGFVPLESLKIGDVVGCNGQAAHTSIEWMRNAKIAAIANGTGVQGIADMAGVSYHTIRKWLRKHGLQFSKRETAEYTTAWNKGLPKEQQPRFDKHASEESRARHRNSAVKGEKSNLFTGQAKPTTWRYEVGQWQSSYRLEILNRCGHSCVECGAKEHLELDHRVPVSQAPELAFDKDNLQILCKICHGIKSVSESAQTVKWSPIMSIEPAGEIMTYDLEVEHSSHNYVANGMIVHNSQRYSSEIPDAWVYSARKQSEKNRQSSVEDCDPEIQDWFDLAQNQVVDYAQARYAEALDLGIAREQARMLLPLSTGTRLYMSGSIRSWIHYIQLRTQSDTQAEHREIAEGCRKLLAAELPTLATALEWV